MGFNRFYDGDVVVAGVLTESPLRWIMVRHDGMWFGEKTQVSDETILDWLAWTADPTHLIISRGVVLPSEIS